MAAAAFIGAAMMIGGNIKSNLDESKAEMQNAQAYESQAAYAKAVHARKLKLLDRQQKDFAGKQKAMFAKSGISFSGSVLDVLVDTQVAQKDEMIAAQNEAAQEISSYQFRANASYKRARALSDPGTMFLRGGGTALSTYANYSARAGTDSDTGTTTAWTNNGRSYGRT